MNREGWWGGWLQQSYQAVRDKVDNVHIYLLYVKSGIIKIILTTIIKGLWRSNCQVLMNAFETQWLQR